MHRTNITNNPLHTKFMKENALYTRIFMCTARTYRAWALPSVAVLWMRRRGEMRFVWFWVALRARRRPLMLSV